MHNSSYRMQNKAASLKDSSENSLVSASLQPSQNSQVDAAHKAQNYKMLSLKFGRLHNKNRKLKTGFLYVFWK